jgi:putative ABC transport system permease protein
VGLTVLLLASSVLYARSYLSLMALEKGFDTSGVASILLRIPPQQLGTAWDRHVKAQAILEHLRSRPGVVAAFAGAPPPWTGDSPATIRQIEIDDRPPAESDLAFPRLRVEPAYFRTLQIPLLAGRMFQPGESPNNVIISRALASRLWPGEDAVGHRFRESPDRPWFTVIGIVGHVRLIEDGTAGPDRVHQLYFARQPPTPPAVGAPSAPAPRFALPSYGFLQFTARVDDRASAADLLHAVRAIDRHSILTLEFVDDLYARQFADRLLATRIVGVFGVVAFVLAAAGIYGLMAYLVAIRAREMGIRIALGADGRALKRLVLGASLRMAALGAAIGVGATVAVSRWTQSQMFGVSATDPLTLIAVSVGVLCVAAVATWAPARQAARVSPRELLQS